MRTKIFLAIVVVFSMVAIFAMLLLGPSVSPQVRPQTTRITSPLAADGLPDYLQAFVDLQRQGVTRDNNAAREFWQAMGPDEPKDADYRLICKELDVAVPGAGDPPPTYLQDPQGAAMDAVVSAWLDAQHAADAAIDLLNKMDANVNATPAGDATDAMPAPLENAVDLNHATATSSLMTDMATDQPWTAADFPPLAEWATANEAPLNRLVSGMAKPKFYSPSPNYLTHPDTSLISVLLPHLTAMRSAGRALRTRAMLRAGEKQYAAAWDDCRACWQLGNLAANGVTLIDKLVGIALRGSAAKCTLGLLQCEDLPESVLRQILDDLRSMPQEVTVADAVDQAERFMYLDSALRVLSGRLGGMNLSDLTGNASSIPVVFSVDANVPLEMGNQWYDRLVKAVQIEDRELRQQELKRFEEEVQSLRVGEPSQFVAGAFSRGRRSELMGQALVTLFLPATTSVVAAQERDREMMTLVQTAAALALYRTQRKEYPSTLAELTPAILATAPTDLYNGNGPLHYERRGDGYLLYSVFENGADDGGTDFDGEILKGDWAPSGQSSEVDREKSDMVVRMPRPRQRLATVKIPNENVEPATGESGPPKDGSESPAE